MLQYIWFGVVSGAFLIIATVGFALTSRVNKFLNIAHAEYMSVSALATYYLTTAAGLPFLVGAALSVTGVAVLGLLIARLVYDPMLAKGGEVLLILSVGVVYLLHGITEFVVSPGTKSFAIPAWAAWQLGPISMTPYQLIIVALAAISFAGLQLYLTHTSAGAAIRAIADNRELAEVRGIDVRRATREAWLISSGLAGVAGVCIGMLGTLTTDVAFEQILLILAVSILAGLGSVYGVAAAALILGLAMDLSTMVIPSGYRTAVAFVLIIAVLLLRPQGLFGKKVRVA